MPIWCKHCESTIVAVGGIRVKIQTEVWRTSPYAMLKEKNLFQFSLVTDCYRWIVTFLPITLWTVFLYRRLHLSLKHFFSFLLHKWGWFTHAGYRSYVRKDGSDFIRCLCGALKEKHMDLDLHAIALKVNSMVAKMTENESKFKNRILLVYL